MTRALPLAVLALAAGCSSAAAVEAGDAGVRPDAASPPLDAGALDAAASDAGPADAALSDAAPPLRPILLVHGIKGSAADWDMVVQRLAADGWPASWIMARTYADPSWGCNVDNAHTLSGWVDELRKATGADTIDLVAHSMGTLSSRYLLHDLSGVTRVRRYVTLGGMHHGLTSSCLSPLDICVWKELCTTGPFIAGLNAAPVTPGPTRWWSIYSDGDQTVPTSSSQLAGATDIMIPGVAHSGAGGLQQSPLVYAALKEALLGP
jgi:pimeloyl-ACP methyl ester carboxylesterase